MSLYNVAASASEPDSRGYKLWVQDKSPDIKTIDFTTNSHLLVFLLQSVASVGFWPAHFI